MGRDIHAVVEYGQDGTYYDFAEVYIVRDYKLFSAIAFGDGGLADGLSYPPRGLPPRYGITVAKLFFVQADEVKKLSRFSEEGEVFNPQEIAEAWGEWAVPEFLVSGLLPDPEWHTPSWLNLNELKEALSHAGLRPGEQSPVFRGVIAAMEALSEAYGADQVRLVFWFDG